MANPSELPVQRLFVICVVIAFGPALALGSTGAGSFSSPWVIAGVMIGSGLLCTAAASIALRASVGVGFVDNALAAAALVTSGMMVLLHGILAPGAFFDDRTREFAGSGQLSAAVAIPPLAYLVLLKARRDQSNSWRVMSLGMPVVGLGLALVLLSSDRLQPLKPKSVGVTVLVVVAVLVHLAAAVHFTQLGRRFGDRYSQQMGLALVLSAAVPVFFYFGGAGSGAYWWAHGLCMSGVGFGAIAIWRKAQVASVTTQLVGSIVTTKLMQSIEVDLAPSVVAQLKEISDPLDPRLRVAMRAGEKLADLKDEQKLEAEVLLPIFHSTLESLTRGPTSA